MTDEDEDGDEELEPLELVPVPVRLNAHDPDAGGPSVVRLFFRAADHGGWPGGGISEVFGSLWCDRRALPHSRAVVRAAALSQVLRSREAPGQASEAPAFRRPLRFACVAWRVQNEVGGPGLPVDVWADEARRRLQATAEVVHARVTAKVEDDDFDVGPATLGFVEVDVLIDAPDDAAAVDAVAGVMTDALVEAVGDRDVGWAAYDWAVTPYD